MEILERQILAVLERTGPAPVALVDHGSPEPRVTRVRNVVAAALCRRLAGRTPAVRPCSMERREGDAYLFNEPLLETLLDAPGYSSGDAVVSMLFLQPGRHAGPRGDIASICAAAQTRHPELRTHMTALVGEDPALTELLLRRLDAALRATGP